MPVARRVFEMRAEALDVGRVTSLNASLGMNVPADPCSPIQVV